MREKATKMNAILPWRNDYIFGRTTSFAPVGKLARSLSAGIALSIAPQYAVADVSTSHKNSELLVGAGISYPMLASVSAGVLASLERSETRPYQPHHAISALANVDLGIGGGMASAGLWVPTGRSGPGLVTAIIAKASIMRTWLVETGSERNQTYRGGVIECLDAAAGMGGKIGVGYFRSRESGSIPADSFLYLYLGVGY